MKSCPKCNRTFPDEGQKFCTFDGGLLIAPQTFDPNATIRATSIDLNAAAAERPTSRDLPDPNATIIENYPATVALPRNTGPTTGSAGAPPTTSDISRPATPPAPPPPPPPVTPPPAPPTPAAEPPRATTGEIAAPSAVAQAPSAPLPPVAKKKSKMPWIIAGVLLFLLLGGGALAGLFFFVVKPKLDEMAAQRNPTPSASPIVSTPTPASTVESPTPAPTVEDNYVPPPGTIQFVNSKDKLDGALADHYFDFSFYYPQNWLSGPKAGVAGATNFVLVERRIPPDFTQENFLVRWYPSTGTFLGDLQSFPQKAEEFSNSLAKSLPEYQKVSQGPTKVNSMDAYEFRWKGLSKGTEKGDLQLWGRVIFLPTGKEGDSTGAILSMFTTSLAPELSSVEDVGTKGEAPVILDSFRFGKK